MQRPATRAARVVLCVLALPVLAFVATVAELDAYDCWDKQWHWPGFCKKLEDCPLKVELSKGRRPETCPWSKTSEVCCPFRVGQLVHEEKKGMSCFHRKYKVRSTCLPQEDCESAKKDQAMGIKVQSCSSGVCCAPSEIRCDGGFDAFPNCECMTYEAMMHNKNRTQPSSVAQKKCLEYVRFVCGRPVWLPDKDRLSVRFPDYCLRDYVQHTKYLVNGVEDYNKNHTAISPSGGEVVGDPREFPHMALLGFGKRSDIKYQCGGSLIAPDFILTAAHCGKVQWALLGTLNRSDSTTKPNFVNLERPRFPQLIEVKEVIKHPKYRRNSQYNDIALLRLKRKAEMTMTTRPACLHTEGEEIAKDVVGAGWGYTGDGEELPSEVLIKVNLTTRPLKDCEDIIDNRRLKSGLADSMICAGGEDIRDTCPGDSGGPLMVRTPKVDAHCMYSIVGVVSFGPPSCGTGLPAVYTRVASFIPWIESVVWPSATPTIPSSPEPGSASDELIFSAK